MLYFVYLSFAYKCSPHRQAVSLTFQLYLLTYLHLFLMNLQFKRDKNVVNNMNFSLVTTNTICKK